MTVTILATPEAIAERELVVEGEAHHHLFRAARVALGEAVRVVDGHGRARDGTVIAVDRRRAVVALAGEAASREPRVHLELLVAAPRPSRASWLIEKGTELGVRAFRLLACERARWAPDREALERLRRVARSAVEQCGRAWLPVVSAPRDLADSLAGRSGDELVVLDPFAAAGPVALPAGGAGRVLVVVGPEGGLTPAELEIALRLGASPMRLVPSVLRVETAALAAAAWMLLQGE